MRRLLLALVGLALLSAACATHKALLTISVAASLTEVGEHLEAAFEAQNPDVDVQLNIGGSAGLVTQIREGAPVDVLLAADALALPADDPLVHTSKPFATNQLVAAVPPNSALTTLAELGDPELRVSACDPSVPCGRLTQTVLSMSPLAESGVTVDSLEPNVRLVRQRIVSAEADVGFVYVTDLTGRSDLRALDGVLDADNVATASVVTASPVADDFLELLTGPQTRAFLDELGFGRP